MSYNPMDLGGRRVLVTGASSGIGRACAVEAARLGASVTLAARNVERLQETLALMERPENHRVCVCDLRELACVQQLFDKAVSEGKIDGVVHSAGVGVCSAITAQTVEEMTSVCTLNFLSFLAMAKCFAKRKYMERGSVVAISSVAAAAGWPGSALYSGTKGALSASVRALALELAPKGVRVNAVQPSHIKTPMFDEVVGQLCDEQGLAELVRKQPFGVGRAEDVAAAVCFLLSDAARFITGSNLVVDGGYLAQ